MATSPYDYRRLYIERSDPHAPTTAVPQGGTIDPVAAYTGAFEGTRPVIAGIWAQVTPTEETLRTMLAVLDQFTRHAGRHGLATWDAVPRDVVAAYVHAGLGHLDNDVHRLRKNTVHAAYLALTDAGLCDTSHPTEGCDPLPERVRTDERGKHKHNAKGTKTRRVYADRVHVRPVSNDEILLIRLATRLAGSKRTRHLSAAAVALCSASATTTEAPQVLWRHITDTTVQLPGRRAQEGREETAISPRTVALDAWGAEALGEWRDERSAHRELLPDASALYTGNHALDSETAGICVDQQVRKALRIADLRREPGLTAGSLRLWAAARHVDAWVDLETGAATAGVARHTLHRQISQLGDRSLVTARR